MLILGNIKTLSKAVEYLKYEFVNEIDNHGGFKDPETSRLADIITDVFSRLEAEVNGYEK
jgi:hypothetical protein